MQLLFRLSALMLLAVISSSAAAIEPLATRQSAFSIPYRIDAAGRAAQRPLEVQLYISTDRGAAWKLHSKAPPEQGHFTFKAEKDGEYWFLVRTKDSGGNLSPKSAPVPELQVVVDTAQPTLELNASRGQAGEITIQWRALDPNLQPQNLKLDYQAKGAADLWQSIAIDPRRTQVAVGSCQGQVTLWTKVDEPLVVRAEITDRAGNLAVTQSEVDVAKKEETPSATPAGADSASPTVGSEAGSAATSPATTSPTPTQEAKPGVVPFLPSIGFRWPANSTRKPLSRSAAEPAPITPYVVQRLPARPAPAVEAPVATSSPSATTWVQPPLKNVEPPTGQRQNNPVTAISAASSAVAASHQPPPGARPRMVNSRSFQLEYDLGDNIPGGARKVELWGTRDGGQSWMSYGADSDNQSPMTVTVEGAGMYGFRILVSNGAGQIEYPPQRGDRPETWINVDLQRPTCRLMPAQPQTVAQNDQLLIAWEAHDEWLAERPISLSYSELPIGPWLPIATGLENTGRYAWLLDSRVPQRIYLRLEARDQAGNVQVHQAPDPVLLNRQTPPSRIREVRPTYQSSQGPQRYRFW